MNVFGKILVVLNLVVALATLAFFVYTKSRPTNWVAQSQELSAQLEIARLSYAAKDQPMRELMQEKRNYQNQMSTKAKEIEDLIVKHKEEVAQLQADNLVLQTQATAADLNKKTFEEENIKVKLEVETISKAYRNSEKDKLDLQDKIKKLEEQVTLYKSEAQGLAGTNERLMDALRKEAEKFRVATAPAKGAGLSGARLKDPNEPNPPPVKVSGEITRVSRDAGDGAGLMVTVSVGADQGVIPNHTLDVYRLTPAPEYLGRLRILSTTERDAVGRLITRGAANPNLKAGDRVVDSIATIGN